MPTQTRTLTNSRGWKVVMSNPPKLTATQWALFNLLGVTFLLMAILQIISFNDFRDTLSSFGLSAPTAWAVGLIVAELWAAATMFKLRLSYAFRAVSALLALLSAGFWFLENINLVSNGNGDFLTNSGFFGGYLTQSPGWWTVVEVSILLFWVLYALGLSKDTLRLK